MRDPDSVLCLDNEGRPLTIRRIWNDLITTGQYAEAADLVTGGVQQYAERARQNRAAHPLNKTWLEVED